MQTVYLAGGFKSAWQRGVIGDLASYECIDPSSHKIKDPIEYTKWDLDAISRSDVILAYMETSNPGGYALALEIGYAKALGKFILLVEEHEDDSRKRYFSMVRASADMKFSTLNEAVTYLKQQ